jgi:hypothetical protein
MDELLGAVPSIEELLGILPARVSATCPSDVIAGSS